MVEFQGVKLITSNKKTHETSICQKNKKNSTNLNSRWKKGNTKSARKKDDLVLARI